MIKINFELKYTMVLPSKRTKIVDPISLPTFDLSNTPSKYIAKSFKERLIIE